MTTYDLAFLDIKNTQESTRSLQSIEIDERILGNTYLALNNQKKDREVLSFTKSRSDFQSGGCKPYKQKGTGRARQGTIRSPLKVGGSVIFGPKPRIVKRKSNKTFLSNTLKQVLLTKVQGSKVLTQYSDIQKAKEFALHLDMQKSYLVILNINSSTDLHLFNRVKNIPNLYFNNVHSLNVEDVLRVDHILYTDQSITSVFTEKELSQ